MKLTRVAGVFSCAAILCALAACGGGGSGSAPGTPAAGGAKSTTLNGMVAMGSPLEGVTVTAYETDGSSCGSATTKSDGTYSMPITCTVPFLLEANTAQGLLVAPWVNSTTIASYMNVTPLTTGLFFGSIAQSGTQSAMLQALAASDQVQLNSYQTSIIVDLQALYPSSDYGVDWPSVDLVTTPFQANHTGIDLVLDQTALALPDATHNSVTITNTNTDQQFSINTPGASTPSLSSVQALTPIASSVVPVNTTIQFSDINYQQALSSTPGSTGSILDAGNGATGSVTFGLSPSTTANFVTNDGGYSWGAPLVYGNGFDSNVSDQRLPAVAMLCRTVASDGTGSNHQKSTDVLIPSDAVPVTDTTQLVGVSFNRYFEDCLQGGTEPATATGNNFSFDGQGNATVIVSGQSLNVTATQMTGALTSTPLVSLGGQAGSTVFSAFRYTTAFGLTRYVLVEHGSDGGSSNYVGVWLQ
jgi:hypothetical protein